MDFISSFLRPSVEAEFVLEGEEEREHVLVRFPEQETQQQIPPLAVYSSHEPIIGKLLVTCSQEIEYTAITATLTGQINVEFGEGTTMFCVTYDLARGSCPGVLPPGPTTFEFDFDVEKEEESYYGSHVQIEYILTAQFETKWQTYEAKLPIFIKKNPEKEPTSSPLSFTVTGNHGTVTAHVKVPRDCFHTKDVIEGIVEFEKSEIPISVMELALVHIEKSEGTSLGNFQKQGVVGSIQIMEGTPCAGDIIPFRVFLGEFGLVPSYEDVLKKISVDYLLRVKILCRSGVSYQKQGAIHLWRKED